MNLHAAVRRALRAALPPDKELDEKGYLRDWRGNLVVGVEEQDFLADLAQGSGRELEGKFRAPHSSSALAVNSFAPFRRRLGQLSVPGASSVSSLAFEARCPCGLPRATPPNLDVLLETESEMVGIESKLSEYFGIHRASFSPRYRTDLPLHLRHGPWFEAMETLLDAPRNYRHLDAAQLTKHAFGLAHQFRDRPVSLLYLYWEPVDASEWDLFALHRAEIEDFSAQIAGGRLRFFHLSYLALWTHWAHSDVGWVRAHAEALLARYGVALNEGTL